MDPLSNFLNKLKMASRTGKEVFSFPASNLIATIAESLEKSGFLSSVKRSKKGRSLELTLSSGEKKRTVTNLRRISRLSKRVYRKSRDIRPVRNGYGTAVLSTPKGILTDKEARAANVGGEVLFEIW